MGLASFSFLQGFTAWNLAVNTLERTIRGGQQKSRELKKWGSYSIEYEGVMTCVDNEENQNFERAKTETSMHTPTPEPKNYHTKIPTCIICSTEEGLMRREKAFENKKGRHYSSRKSHLTVCSDPHCNTICRTRRPEESKIRQLHQFQGMSCFQIFHTDACRNLFVDIERNGKNYTRSLHHHLIVTMISNLYKEDLPRRSERTSQGRYRYSTMPWTGPGAWTSWRDMAWASGLPASSAGIGSVFGWWRGQKGTTENPSE